jgi:hypothetical protein
LADKKFFFLRDNLVVGWLLVVVVEISWEISANIYYGGVEGGVTSTSISKKSSKFIVSTMR